MPAREPAAGAAGVAIATANVVGTLCENNDWFAKDRPLPAAASVGDLFVVHDTGAHSHSMGFNYNAKLRAPELLIRAPGTPPAPPGAAGSLVVDGGARVDVIRERETMAVLYGNTRLPADLLPRDAGVAAAYPWGVAGRGSASGAAADAAGAVGAAGAAGAGGGLVARGAAVALTAAAAVAVAAAAVTLVLGGGRGGRAAAR